MLCLEQKANVAFTCMLLIRRSSSLLLFRFYQLLAGLSPDKLTALGLTKKPDDFVYLRQSECTTVPSIDDVADFKHVVRAMDVLGLKEADQTSLWNVLAAILLLGELWHIYFQHLISFYRKCVVH